MTDVKKRTIGEIMSRIAKAMTAPDDMNHEQRLEELQKGCAEFLVVTFDAIPLIPAIAIIKTLEARMEDRMKETPEALLQLIKHMNEAEDDLQKPEHDCANCAARDACTEPTAIEFRRGS